MPALGFILCIISTFVGFSGFVAFLILGNLPACVWAFASGIVNSMSTHLHWLRLRNTLEEWYSSTELTPLSIVGFVAFTSGVMGIVFHSALEILQRTPILPINKSQVIPIVWAALTAKSGIVLLCTCRRFNRAVAVEERTAIVENIETGDIQEEIIHSD